MLSRGLALPLALAGLLVAGAAPAAADSSFVLNAGIVTITAAPGGDDLLEVTRPGGTRFQLSGAEKFSSAAGCTLSADATRVDCAGAVTRVVANLDDGADTLKVSGMVAMSLEADLDSGGDTAVLAGLVGPSVVRGGAGNDVLDGGQGADRLDAGTDDDTLHVSVAGADEFIGGPGFDTLVTETGKPAIMASLDDQANDGGIAGGNAANAHADIEDVVGGDGSDSVVGSPASNALIGNGGNDRLEGGGGYDTFRGGEGDDTLLALDGLSELVECGEDSDTAVIDDVDIPVDCESVQASADARPDADGDGVRKPGDCDDRNAGIHPGAVEILDDNIDQDCNGADAVNLDRDGDGYPRPGDCDDNRRDVHPGGTEVPGNAVDEDCNHVAKPFPRLLASIVLSTRTTGRVTRVLAFNAIDLAGGELIGIGCAGRGCPYRARVVKVRRRGRRSLLGAFAKARLRPGAKITVRIARADGVARQFTAVARAGKLVKRTSGCIIPPRRSPKRC